MNFKKSWTMINQSLYASSLFAKGSNSKKIFWPGCAMLKLDSNLMRELYDALKVEVPNLGISTFCCSKPTMSIGNEKQNQTRVGELENYYASSGVEEIYTLCPNCLATLPKTFNGKVISAWPLVLEYVKKNSEKSEIFTNEYKLHHPCTVRNLTVVKDEINEILDFRGIDYLKDDKVICCGRKDMIFIANPEAADKIWNACEKKHGNLPAVTYCESCVEAFRGKGKEAYNVLEVVFDKKVERSVANRIKNARNLVK